ESPCGPPRWTPRTHVPVLAQKNARSGRPRRPIGSGARSLRPSRRSRQARKVRSERNFDVVPASARLGAVPLVPSPGLAKKSRTPTPPRPVQAPKRRESTARPTFSLGNRNLVFWGLAGVGVVTVIAVVLAVVLGGGGGGGSGSSASVAKSMSAAGCTFVTKPVLPPKDGQNFHNDASTPTTKVKWSTFPPSGGGHYQLWAVWGFYQQPVPPDQVVHNEEHGGVVIWWGPDVPRSEIDKLASFYQSSPDGVFGTPIAGLGNKIALTAWTGDP